MPVPKPYMKELSQIDQPVDRVYGRGAWDESLKDCNRIKQWSFVQKNDS